MGELSPGAPPSTNESADHLDSWKEIAAYLNRDVTTVQRWEKKEGMPVHRHLHNRMGSVSASRAELDTWARSRNTRAAQENGNGVALPDPPPVRLSAAKPTARTSWKLILSWAAVGAALIACASLWLRTTDYFWRNPLEGARFQMLTDFEGVARDAALSRDGQFVAFLSNHESQVDVWVTQVGSGQFHSLTRGNALELVNPSIRTLGFSPDGAFVTFWVRKPNSSSGGDIGIWAVPTLGGQPKPYLEGVAEFDWSRDGARLAYHTPGPGDPLFVSDGAVRPGDRPIFTAPAGLHAHFPSWSPDGAFIYFVQGALPDKLAIWRIAANGGTAERITAQSGNVSYPVLLDRHRLMYLAGDPDGSGPWLYGMDLAHRLPHRLTTGPENYTSLAASADGRRLVATLAAPKRTLWRLRIADSNPESSTPAPISLTTGAGFSPRLGPDYLLYVSAIGTSEAIWKLAGGNDTELWSAQGAHVFGGPAISPDGKYVAFSVLEHGRKFLYVMQSDGTNVRIANNSLNLQGAPAWRPDSRSITSAVSDQGRPRLFHLPLNGGSATPLLKEYSVDPAWAPDGHFVIYSGPDIGTRFAIKAVERNGDVHQMPSVTLTRGARHVVFAPGGRSLILLRGEIQHKNLWSVDLQSGVARQLTRLPADFDIHDFDLSPDGREAVLERVQERSDIVLMELAQR